MATIGASTLVQAGDVSTGATNSAARKILFLGNSITLVGGCGASASAPEKDYVHLLASAIATPTGTPLRIAPTPSDLPRWYYGNPPLALGDANVLNIRENLGKDPVAERLLRNMLNYVE